MTALRRVAIIAGARPNFMKVAPLLRALEGSGFDCELVHTGQHYDRNMSEVFFEELGIREPDVNFDVGSGAPAVQAARIMTAFHEWLAGADVDAVLVAGDVTSTIACTLVAATAQVPVGHVEAGLRSFDRTMPEEINRVAVDALATWLFTPSADADAQLAAEGVEPARVHLVGNIMIDTLFQSLDRARGRGTAERLGLEGPYCLATLHRPALVDDPAAFGPVLDALDELCDRLPVILPVHPRTRAKLAERGLETRLGRVRTIDPLGYLDFLDLESGATLVVTDSGGVQEETTALGVPCLTARNNTERPITVTEGTNRLVGLDGANILAAAKAVLEDPPAPRRPALWDGHAADRIVEVLRRGVPQLSWRPPTMPIDPAHRS